jgi:hypothetical protein
VTDVVSEKKESGVIEMPLQQDTPTEEVEAIEPALEQKKEVAD